MSEISWSPRSSQSSANNNLIKKQSSVVDEMNSIVQDLSSTSSSCGSIQRPRSSSLRPNGTLKQEPRHSDVSLPSNFTAQVSNSKIASNNVVKKSESGPKTISGTFTLFNKHLRKALNVHPERYRRKDASPARSLSSGRMSCPRSQSIDFTVPKNRERFSGSLCREIPVPVIHFPDDSNLKPLLAPPAEDHGFSERDSYLSGDFECKFTDEEDNVNSFDDIITINVSGMRFQTRERTLARFSETILGNPIKRRRFYNPRKKEYFFDRHRESFESILHIYQSNGDVIRPDTVPIEIFLEELKFYQFSPEILDLFWKNEGYVKTADPKMPSNPVQRKLWELMEYPDSSLAARILAGFSILVILTSIFSFILETIPELKLEDDDEREWNSAFFWLEFSCSIWFSIELVARFLGCPEKYAFVKSFLNILDFVAVAPFFVNILLSTGNTASAMSFSVLRIIRLIRVFRIFKLSRHSGGLRVLGKTFKASTQEFMLLLFFLSIALVLFSSGVYFAEQNEPNTKFTSIPASFWFVLATLSTVGYGDIVPLTVYGKIVGGGCALIGVITLALPVPIIVSNFKHFYRQEVRLAKLYVVAQQDTASNVSRKSFDVGN